MKTKRSMITLAMIAFVTTATISVNAQKGDRPPPPTPPAYEKNVPAPPQHPKMDRNMRRLSTRNHARSPIDGLPGVTEEQQEQIKKERLKNMKALTPLKNEIKEKHAHLVTLLSSDDLNMKDVNKTIDELSALNTKMLQQQISHHRAMRDMLTPDQKVLYDARPKPFLRRK